MRTMGISARFGMIAAVLAASGFNVNVAREHSIRQSPRNYSGRNRRLMHTGPMRAGSMRAGSRPAEKYRKRIEAGLIPESQILRNPIFAKAA